MSSLHRTLDCYVFLHLRVMPIFVGFARYGASSSKIALFALILAVTISVQISYMRPKLLCLLVPQWLFIDIKADDLERIDFFGKLDLRNITCLFNGQSQKPDVRHISATPISLFAIEVFAENLHT